MSRLLDLKPDDEADVVNRVVMQVHRAVEDIEASENEEQFKKTVFHQSEDTVVETPGSKQRGDTDTPPAPPEPPEQQPAVPQQHAKPPSPPPPAPPEREPVNVSRQAELEYSSMASMDTGQPGMSNARKLMLIASIVILFTVVTAYILYSKLVP